MLYPFSAFSNRACACLALLLGALSATAADGTRTTGSDAGSADGAWPASRRHVRILDGTAFKFTSKLATIVELNFTMNNGHQPGKITISNGLTRIAANYGGLKVNKFTTRNDGSARGEVPDFTVADLLAGEVIVSNNIDGMGDAAIGTDRQSAIRSAIETNGRGYLAFHGSGESQSNGWAWFTNTLHPMMFMGHESRSTAPVYKHLAESSHVVLEGILKANTTLAAVPDELDASGNEVLAQSVPTRPMKNEWFHWGRDISRDPAYQDKVTVLLKYDVSALGNNEFDPNYRRKGGGLFTYLYRVGAGLTSYVLPGHESGELLDSRTGLDGGVGDFDRYVAQTLFFLAGYRQEPCDTSCLGLPVVDSRFHWTGENFAGAVSTRKGRPPGSVPIHFEILRPDFQVNLAGPVAAELVTPAGRAVKRMSGRGPLRHAFAVEGLLPGIYFLRVRAGSHPVRTKLYAIGG